MVVFVEPDIDKQIEIIERLWGTKPEDTIEKFIPPEAGDAPEELKELLSEVYSKCRQKWVSEHPKDKENKANKESCARQAWSVVKNKWRKENDKWISKGLEVVNEIKDSGYPTSDPSYNQAHREAEDVEKKLFGEQFEELQRIIGKVIPKGELAATHDKEGNITISRKIPEKFIPELEFHEDMEHELMKADEETDISFNEIEEGEESLRTFEGWASVEVIDKQGEIIPVERIIELMPIYMKRGGIIVDSHSGRHCGKVTKYEKRFNEKAKAWGIYIWGLIFNDYKFDDLMWNAIKAGKYKGFSIGGQDFGKVMECDRQKCFNRIEDLEMWEISIVQSPANKASWITTHAIAKVDEEKSNARYRLHLKTGRDEGQQVGWMSEERQIKRFEMLAKIFGNEKNPQILDAGAGMGAFANWMKENGYDISQYQGIDIMPEFVNVSPYKVELKSIQDENRQFDYIIASGVWNWTILDSPKEPYNEFMKDIKHLLKLAKRGMAFNFFIEKPHPEYVAFDLNKVIEDLKPYGSISVKKISDREVTIFVRKFEEMHKIWTVKVLKK